MSVTAITTWSHVQSRLDLEAAMEAEVTALIGIASTRAEQYIGRVVAATDVVRYFNGSDSCMLSIEQWPVNTVATVAIDQAMVFDAAHEISDYTLVQQEGFLYRSAGWPRGIKNIKVAANVGYTSVPDDIVESVVQLLGYWLQSPQISWLGTGSAQDGGYQTQYVGVMDLPFQVRNVWDSYRGVRV